MSFQEAIKVCLQRKYADFHGRARRSEFWFFVLFSAIVSTIGDVLDAILGLHGDSFSGTGPIQGILQLALLVPSLAVGARRLHDTGRTGWWQLIGLVPIAGWIVLLIFFLQDSKPANQYGPSPKDPAQGYAPAADEPPYPQY